MIKNFITLLLSLFLLNSLTGQIYINEFMADNDAITTDESGEFEDWIELYNAGSSVVDIGGFFITDDYSDVFKFQIPTGDSTTKIQPGGFLVLWADDDINDGALHIGIKLSKDGEKIRLTDRDSILVDSISFGAQTTDISMGRLTDGGATWTSFSSPTPNTSNQSVSIKDNTAISGIHIFPNPNSSDKVYFSQKVDIEIFDLSGRQIKTAEISDEISISELKNGIYILRINGQFVRKLIVE